MAVTKVPLREAAGVQLIRCEEVSTSGRVLSTHYRLTTMRPHQPRVLAEEQAAHAAFDREVGACLADPFMQGLVGSEANRAAATAIAPGVAGNDLIRTFHAQTGEHL